MAGERVRVQIVEGVRARKQHELGHPALAGSDGGGPAEPHARTIPSARRRTSIPDELAEALDKAGDRLDDFARLIYRRVVEHLNEIGTPATALERHRLALRSSRAALLAVGWRLTVREIAEKLQVNERRVERDRQLIRRSAAIGVDATQLPRVPLRPEEVGEISLWWPK